VRLGPVGDHEAGSSEGKIEKLLPRDRTVTGCQGTTLRAERLRGGGPPWLKIGRDVFYSEEGFRDWLRSIERRPARTPETFYKIETAEQVFIAIVIFGGLWLFYGNAIFGFK
jgi:hypothetical protein